MISMLQSNTSPTSPRDRRPITNTMG